MHQEVRRDPERADLERLPGVSLDELHLRRHVTQPDGKVGRIGLICKRRLQRLRRTSGTDDRQMGPRDERRQEKRKALDVVEVRVGDEQMRLQRLARGVRIPKLGDARTGIDN